MPFPVSARRRRSRLSQRKVWRNSKRKRRKLQRRLRNRPNWSVGCCLFFFLFFLIHIRPPLLAAVRVSTCRVVGHCKSRRCPCPECGKDWPLFKYSCHFGFVYIHPNKALFSFSLDAQHAAGDHGVVWQHSFIVLNNESKLREKNDLFVLHSCCFNRHNSWIFALRTSFTSFWVDIEAFLHISVWLLGIFQVMKASASQCQTLQRFWVSVIFFLSSSCMRIYFLVHLVSNLIHCIRWSIYPYNQLLVLKLGTRLQFKLSGFFCTVQHCQHGPSVLCDC